MGYIQTGRATNYQITLVSRSRCLSPPKGPSFDDHIIETMGEYVERRFERTDVAYEETLTA
ncbi:hypothetical protein V5735_15095 (plasmid) [Haladaptatus sp. SPP-AMP-3]|uniref:hypothetical protein n=1 Tax=Haladaptatus sp. SPP-AMP-3 TaxID=3121295 RepID=UPI003C2AF9C6